MYKVVTTALDVLGLLLVAAGIGAAVAMVAGAGGGLVAAGIVVLAGRWLADRQARPEQARGEQL
ncbi:hypothetical protein AB0M35_18095 [Micromonospora sp. NPDC051196]|uniref:hypothetical protein n=1 Tax=Micromonospora sp. NPDC051196 TaxID=3155281 RepID=UPI00342FB5A5